MIEVTKADAKRIADQIEQRWGFRPTLDYAAALARFVIELDGDPETLGLSKQIDESRS